MVFNLVTTKRNTAKLREMALYVTNCVQYLSYATNGPFITVQSTELVPGTIIMIKPNIKLPCDCILLEGECLVDEASLTGESVAVVKSCDKKHKIYEGTIVIQTSKGTFTQGLPCLVVGTGCFKYLKKKN